MEQVVASTAVSSPLGVACRVRGHDCLGRRPGATVAAVRAGTNLGPSIDHDHRRSESVPVVVAKINATASPFRAFVRPSRALPKRFRIDTDLPVALRATGRNAQRNARNVDRGVQHA